MAFITPVLRSFLRPTRPRFSTKSIPLHQTPQPTTPSPSTSLPNKINKSNSRDTQSQTNHGNSHEPPPPPPPSWFGHPFRVILTTLKFVAFTHLIWEYVISMAPASGPSMLPTFEVLGEWLLVSKLHRFGRGVTVGDVVAYNIPINDEVGVKRVLGMPGDYVLMDTPGDGVGLGEGNMIQVPKGHCWIVGDNLVASRDSRYFGPVPLALVRGKVIATMRPFSEFRWIMNTSQKVSNPPED